MQEHITKSQVQDVIDFSQGLALANNIGFYTPWMSNELLKNLNNNPRIPTFDKIKSALEDYKNNEKNLQGFNEFMTNFDMIFKRTLYSYANMLSFDLEIFCTNAYTQADYQSEEYKEDKKKIYEFLDKFDYQKEFRNVVVELLMRETYFTWFRKTKWGNKGMKFALQIMPQDYCMLTGYWEKGLLWDLDYNYFLQSGVDIEGYDPSIMSMFNKIFGGDTPINYRPTVPLNSRTGQFAYWGQTSPTQGAWAWKMNPNNFASPPFLTPFLKDAIRNQDIERLQYNKDIIAAFGILAGEIRLLDKTASGQKDNQFAIDPVTLGAFMGKAKAGLGELVKLAAMPTENIKFFQFADNNTDMYKDQLVTSAGVGSSISRVIYSSDRMGQAELEAGITDQYNTMKPLYYQFNNFMDFFANKLTSHYKFAFRFNGCSYGFEREQRFDRLLKLADKGLVLGPSSFASAMGMRPQDFERSLEESKASGWINTLSQMMLNVNTTAGGEGGRPRTDKPTDSTEMNHDVDDGL